MVSVFSKRLEYFNLFFGLLLVAVNIYFAIVRPGSPTSVHDIQLIIQYLAYDRAHVFFTPILIAVLPETREFLAKAYKTKEPWIVVAIGISVVVLAYEFAKQQLWSPSPIIYEGVKYALLLLLWAPHSIRQFYGFSRIYYHRGLLSVSLTETEKQQIERYDSRFRKLFRIFLVIAVLQRMATFTPALVSMIWLKWLSALILAAVVIKMIWLVGQFPQKSLWLSKQVYLSRLFLHPLMALSSVAVGSIALIHGVEYLLMCMTMFQRSEGKAARHNFMVFPFFGVLVGLVLLAGLEPRLSLLVLGKTFVEWLKPFNLAILVLFAVASYLHFYLDGILYKLKGPDKSSRITNLLLDIPSLNNATISKR